MQDVNNDMDDLFRKAAEQYPLKTEGANWGEVLAGLGDADAPMAVANDKEKRKKRVLWLLLLLPLALLYSVWYNGSEPGNKKRIAGRENTYKKITGEETEGNRSNTSHTKSSSHIATPPITTTTTTVTQRATKAIVNKATNVVKNTTNKNTITKVSYFTSIKTKRLSKAGNAHLPVSNSKNNSSAASLFATGKTIAATSSGQPVDKANVVTTDNKNNIEEKQPNDSANRIQNTITAGENNDIVVKQNGADSSSSAVNKADRAVAKSMAENNKNNKKIKVNLRTQPGFYAGLLASFDVSTIKLQRVNKTGYSLNVVAGYRFSKHLSVESGLGWSMKNYYSVGKYFDKTKTGIPDPVKIYYTNGDCKMFEVPLNVKYDFALHKKSNLFAVVGLSSYFMKKEDYSYHAIWDTWVYDTTKHYTNSGANWFSVANISIGYQLPLNRHNTLRVEPYIKVPLHGVGIANMPITSMGITVGFTRSF